MKKILVAVDGLEPSMHAARFGLELCEATGAALTVAYSVRPVLLPGDVPFSVTSEVQQSEAAHGKRVLADVLDELGAAASVTSLELEGPPAERISEVAEKDDYDLVVVGTHARGAVSRLLVRSVADRLIHLCKKPVLVVR